VMWPTDIEDELDGQDLLRRLVRGPGAPGLDLLLQRADLGLQALQLLRKLRARVAFMSGAGSRHRGGRFLASVSSYLVLLGVEVVRLPLVVLEHLLEAVEAEGRGALLLPHGLRPDHIARIAAQQLQALRHRLEVLQRKRKGSGWRDEP
jgi:hypothetical protein